MTSPAGEQVELIDDERIVPRGSARTTWLVRQGDAWVKAADFPGATSERRSAGPGTVWERAVQLVLPRGTELMKVESRPRPEPPKDPLSYLGRRNPGLPRVTRRTPFRVGVGGRVQAVPRAR